MRKAPSWCRELYTQSKKRAKKKGIEFDLTPEFIEDLYNKTGRRCCVTGIYFKLENDTRYLKNPLFPSVDRIDSSKGYTKDNCRLVCVCANYAMNEWGDWTLHQMAKGIAEGGLSSVDPEKDRLAKIAVKLERENEDLKNKNRDLELKKLRVFPASRVYDYIENKELEAEFWLSVLGDKLDKMMYYNDYFRDRMILRTYNFVKVYTGERIKYLEDPRFIENRIKSDREEEIGIGGTV